MRDVLLRARHLLAAPGEPIEYVYFPRDSVISLLVPMQDGTTVEGATIGNEGLIGLQVFLGNGKATEDVVVQIAGSAVRMPANAFREFVRNHPPLAALLGRYTLALMNQLARTAGCNRLHNVDQRCARWLLMTHDRVGDDTFALTHELLASTLGVRRASVTEAAGGFQRAGLIAYRFGKITIRNRPGLEAVACEDYRLTRAAYDGTYA